MHCEYKIDTFSHGNIMPLFMFKYLFPKITTVSWNKYILKSGIM